MKLLVACENSSYVLRSVGMETQDLDVWSAPIQVLCSVVVTNVTLVKDFGPR